MRTQEEAHGGDDAAGLEPAPAPAPGGVVAHPGAAGGHRGAFRRGARPHRVGRRRGRETGVRDRTGTGGPRAAVSADRLRAAVPGAGHLHGARREQDHTGTAARGAAVRPPRHRLPVRGSDRRGGAQPCRAPRHPGTRRGGRIQPLPRRRPQGDRQDGVGPDDGARLPGHAPRYRRPTPWLRRGLPWRHGGRLPAGAGRAAEDGPSCRLVLSAGRPGASARTARASRRRRCSR